ncbi:MAG: flavin reductase family protein [Lentisphaeria bacterium]
MKTSHKKKNTEMDFQKIEWKPGTLLSPVPVVLVSCGGSANTKPNIITIAWAGTICSDPPMLSISVRPERYSFDIINREKEFVVNMPGTNQAGITDWCGVKSGRNVDKFSAMKLTAAPCSKVKAPMILECPVSLECIVKNKISLGSHVMFLAEIVAVQVRASLVDKRGKLHLEKAGLISYSHGSYFHLGVKKGSFGFSVRKK